jgi:hypothetical protein
MPEALLEYKGLSENEELSEDKKLSALRFVTAIRRGYRWAELVSLFGVEIILLENPFQNTSSRGSKISNIAGTVNNGSDDDFRKLKELLETRCLWIRDVYGKLKGVVKLIVQAEELRSKDLSETTI